MTVLVQVATGELIALKRLGPVRGRTTASIAIYTPEEPRKATYTFFLMSGVYLGLDQQYDFSFTAVMGEAAEQVELEEELEGEE
jgi:activating signal cointegrator complex subunit 3